MTNEFEQLFQPQVVVGADYDYQGDRSYLEELRAWLHEPMTRTVLAISYVTEFAALQECGLLEPRESTRLIVRPPDGLSRADAEALLAVQEESDGSFRVRQLRAGVEDAVAHLKVILAGTGDGKYAFSGSSNFTRRGLSSNLEVNSLLGEDARGFRRLEDTLEALWSDWSTDLDPESFATELWDPTGHRPSNLLDFQGEALRELREAYRKQRGRGGALLTLPTGTGKTVVATRFLLDEVLTSPQSRVLWVTPQRELCVQASATFFEQRPFFTFPQLKVECPERLQAPKERKSLSTDHNLIFRVLHSASESAHGQAFDAVVVDEAHWGASDSAYLLPQLIDGLDSKFWLGLTATPFRTEHGDLSLLNRVFPRRVDLGKQVDRAADAAGRPVRARVRHKRVPTGFEIEVTESQCTARELGGKALGLFNDAERNAKVARAWKRDEHGQTLVFAFDTAHANALFQAFRLRHPFARVQVLHTGDVGAFGHELVVAPSEDRFNEYERREVYERFRRGDLDVLIGVNLCVMGVDFPSVRTLFMARPTLSPVLYTQMVGRGRRGPAFGGTEEVNVVDFVDQVKAHELLRERFMNFDAERDFEKTKIRRADLWRKLEGSFRGELSVRELRQYEVGEAVYRVFTPGRAIRKPLRGVKNLSTAVDRSLRSATSNVRMDHVVEYFVVPDDMDRADVETLVREFSSDEQFIR